MELNQDDSTKFNFVTSQTSVIVDNDNNDQQKKEEDRPQRIRDSSLSLSQRQIESPSPKETPNNFVIENNAVYDFDPDNALIFNKPQTSEQASHKVQTHAGIKRKHSDIGDSKHKSSQKKNKCATAHCDMNYGSESTPDELYEDGEAKLLDSMIIEEYCAKLKKSKSNMSQTAAWRLGPAKYWFDLLGVPESGDGFDYGFGLADESDEDEDSYDDVEEDAFLMVSQVHWEDDIIWDIDDAPQKQKPTDNKVTDWTPTLTNSSSVFHKEKPKIVKSQNGILYSTFPVENEELVYGLWESEIIWDAKAMKKILQPKILEFDPSDENIILAIPEDSDPTMSSESVEIQSKPASLFPHTENIKSILSKTVATDPSEEKGSQTVESLNLDPFNISNDMYYITKSTDKSSKLHASHMPHSIPVLQLKASLIPTYMGPKRLRIFHRAPLKRYVRGRLSQPGPNPVLSLTKYIAKKEKLRQEALNSGELFFMRSSADLSGRDGNLVLVEFSEEHPPLMNFVGMCSKIKNYYKRKTGKDNGPPEYKYGETAYPQNGLFLGNLAPGQSLQALENNMYRAPIYEHKVNETDFLVIRTRNQYYIREIDAVYVAGQQCPLYEVPAPTSKKVADFMRNFLQVYAYKVFSKSPRIHKDVLKKAFPTLKVAFIKKHLSFCADYNYTKGDPGGFHWVLKPTFRLPLEDEIRSLVSPEQCCAYFSMMAAQQRLKDAGYGDKSAFVLQEKDVNDEEMQSKLDDEVKAAPWNTTRAYIDAMNGKCGLQLIGPADPTGCGEGFSYVRVPLKSVFKQEEMESKPKKITGTEADLRYLSAKGAESILRSYGVSAQDIMKLTRWELVDAVRTLSTIREDRGEEGFAKFARSKRFSIAGCQQKYKEECQRIFDLQNYKLSSSEVLSSDDEDEYLNEDIEEVEKIAEDIEKLFTSKGKSGSQLEFEREEREREELLKMLCDDASSKEKPIEPKKDESLNLNVNPDAPRTLKIRRTFRNADGSEYTRTEIVRNSAVIDAYLRIRSTKDTSFIKHYAYEDEELAQEKKKIEAELKNIKIRERRKEKNQLNRTNIQATQSHSKELTGEKIRCENCDRYGNTKISSICQMNGGAKNKLNVDSQKLVKVGGAKLKFSMKLIKNAEDTSPSKEKQSQKKHKRSSGDEVDYNKHYQRPAGTNRQRADPVVLLSTIFEEILTVIRGKKEFQTFLFPVNTKALPDYLRIIGKPMDLQTIRDNIRQRKYQSRKEFLSDIVQIKENSLRYNGATNTLTDSAQKMLNLCVELLAKKEDKIIKLENAIEPLIDNNDQEAFSDMISEVIKEIKSMPQATLFLKPVNKKTISSKSYYNIVKNPMDLETMSKKVTTHKYRSRADVMQDFQLIYDNCVLYNGKSSSMTIKAGTLLDIVKKRFDDLSHQILHLESSIASVQERAMRQADIDTSWQYEDDHSGTNNPMDLSDDEFEESAMDTDCIERNVTTSFVKKLGPTVLTSLNLSDDDSEDSNTDMNHVKENSQPTTLPTIPETSVLEEDLRFSSDDDM